MIWKAWSNGAHHQSGAGYGFKIDAADRDKYFDTNWKTVIIQLPSSEGEIEVEVNVDKASFWNKTCRELINQGIGRWLRDSHYAPWPSRKLPQFEVQPVGDRHFKVIKRI